ncbi:hypothetical protein D3C87_2173390 [compost metagenome]
MAAMAVGMVGSRLVLVPFERRSSVVVNLYSLYEPPPLSLKMPRLAHSPSSWATS